MSEAARGTEHSHQQKEENKDSVDHRLGNREALLILFSVALMPGYMLPAALEFISKECFTGWLIIFVVLIFLAGLGNYVTLKMLS